MSAFWPSTLPDRFLQQGYSEEFPNTTLRTKMDAGPSKARRRFTAAPVPISGELVLSAAQVEDFKSFYVDILSGGSLPFEWVHPRTRAAASLRFTDQAPKISAESGGYYRVSLNLMVLP